MALFSGEAWSHFAPSLQLDLRSAARFSLSYRSLLLLGRSCSTHKDCYFDSTMKLVLLAALLPATAVAFSTPSGRVVSSTSQLHVGAAWSLEENYDSVLDSDAMMHRAQACADSEECSLEEAQTCLDEVLHIQSNCVSGGVLSTSSEVCGLETYDVLPGVVQKIRSRSSSTGRSR